MATTFTGRGITYFQIATWKSGLKACKVGMRVNRAYTPGNLRKCVEQASGKKFKRTDYDPMIAECEKMLADILAEMEADKAAAAAQHNQPSA